MPDKIYIEIDENEVYPVLSHHQMDSRHPCLSETGSTWEAYEASPVELNRLNRLRDLEKRVRSLYDSMLDRIEKRRAVLVTLNTAGDKVVAADLPPEDLPDGDTPF